MKTLAYEKLLLSHFMMIPSCGLRDVATVINIFLEASLDVDQMSMKTLTA